MSLTNDANKNNYFVTITHSRVTIFVNVTKPMYIFLGLCYTYIYHIENGDLHCIITFKMKNIFI